MAALQVASNVTVYSALGSGSAVCAGGDATSFVADGDVEVLQPTVQIGRTPRVRSRKYRSMFMGELPWFDWLCVDPSYRKASEDVRAARSLHGCGFLDGGDLVDPDRQDRNEKHDPEPVGRGAIAFDDQILEPNLSDDGR